VQKALLLAEHRAGRVFTSWPGRVFTSKPGRGAQFLGVEYNEWCWLFWVGGLLANRRGVVSEPYQLEERERTQDLSAVPERCLLGGF